jgi:transcriptional regulator with XRE-family HTH domain
MDWKRIRAHYERAFRAARRRGLTQAKVAEAGGLKGQNVVSKLLANESKGPQVETFVKAVHGLGMPVSLFFAQLEQPHEEHAIEAALAAVRQHAPADEETWIQLGRAIGRAIAREVRLAEERDAGKPARRAKRR